MTQVKRVVLDVLKPHQPDALELAKAIAGCGVKYRVQIKVVEMDEQTETLMVVVEAGDMDFEQVRTVIEEFGASLHSIDEVEVLGTLLEE